MEESRKKRTNRKLECRFDGSKLIKLIKRRVIKVLIRNFICGHFVYTVDATGQAVRF